MAANATLPQLTSTSAAPPAPALARAMPAESATGAHYSLRSFTLADLPEVRGMLLAGYCSAKPGFWDAGIARLRAVPPMAGDPPLGVFLECDGQPVGVALLLPSRRPGKPEGALRVNASSWAILPQARGRALWMARHAMANPMATYTALTPIPSANAMLQRIGFQAVSHQCVLGFTPRLCRAGGPNATLWHGREALQRLRDDPLAEALEDHVRLGCLVMALDDGQSLSPLVWRSQRRLTVLRTAELVYARSQAQVAAHAGALARRLLRLGFAMLAFEAHADLVPGFPSTRLFQRRLARGAYEAQGIDHLYSELVYLHR
jgi:hypothetical protein